MPRVRASVVTGFGVFLGGCLTPPPPGGPPPADPAPASAGPLAGLEPLTSATPRVGNEDERGVQGQPDYDAQAVTLQERFGGRLESRGVPAPARACADMLDAAAGFYDRTLEEPQRTATARQLRETRKADQAACVKETSPEAATCAAWLLTDGDGELAWALDQCTRAFPR